MKSTTALFLAAAVSVAFGQDLPSCVNDCITLASATASCMNNQDIHCFCTSGLFLDTAAQCYVQQCTPAETAEAVQASFQLCSQYGYTISVGATASSALAAATSGLADADAGATTSSSFANDTVSNLSSQISSAVSSASASAASQVPASSSAGRNAYQAAAVLVALLSTIAFFY